MYRTIREYRDYRAAHVARREADMEQRAAIHGRLSLLTRFWVGVVGTFHMTLGFAMMMLSLALLFHIIPELHDLSASLFGALMELIAFPPDWPPQ